MSERTKGLAVTAAGVLILSPEALLIRLVETDPWTLIFWRSVLFAGTLAVAVWLAGGRPGDARCAPGRAGWIAAACFGANGVLFVVAVGQTAVANLFAIGGTAPLLAALLSRYFLGEVVRLRTWAAIAACLAGIAVIVAGSVGGGRLAGDLAAFGAAASMAGVFVALRSVPQLDSRVPLALGAVLSALAALPFAAPLAVPAAGWPYLLLLGLLIGPLAFALITLGPRYLSAAEVSLVMLIELVLAPYLVWLAFGEQPPAATWLGAGLILATLAVYYGAEIARASGAARDG